MFALPYVRVVVYFYLFYLFYCVGLDYAAKEQEEYICANNIDLSQGPDLISQCYLRAGEKYEAELVCLFLLHYIFFNFFT
jgi:hypothetical protein